MVEYTDWTRIGHEVYKAKGGTYGGTTATEVTRMLAEYWSENTAMLRSASEQEARNVAERQMRV